MVMYFLQNLFWIIFNPKKLRTAALNSVLIRNVCSDPYRYIIDETLNPIVFSNSLLQFLLEPNIFFTAKY